MLCLFRNWLQSFNYNVMVEIVNIVGGIEKRYATCDGYVWTCSYWFSPVKGTLRACWSRGGNVTGGTTCSWLRGRTPTTRIGETLCAC